MKPTTAIHRQSEPSPLSTIAHSPRAARRASLYRLIWRWHFYAGLFCIPFVLALSLTGSIYLFRAQIDAWLDAPYNHVGADQRPLLDRIIGYGVAAHEGQLFGLPNQLLGVFTTLGLLGAPPAKAEARYPVLVLVILALLGLYMPLLGLSMVLLLLLERGLLSRIPPLRRFLGLEPEAYPGDGAGSRV